MSAEIELNLANKALDELHELFNKDSDIVDEPTFKKMVELERKIFDLKEKLSQKIEIQRQLDNRIW